MPFLVKLRSFFCKFSRACCNSCFFLILLQHKPGFAPVGRGMIGVAPTSWIFCPPPIEAFATLMGCPLHLKMNPPQKISLPFIEIWSSLSRNSSWKKIEGFYWWGKYKKWFLEKNRGILLVGKRIEFFGYFGDRSPPVGKIVTCTLKNHNLLFIIKHFESTLGIIKNTWLWVSKNTLLSTNFRKNTSVNNFQKICQWWFSKLQ